MLLDPDRIVIGSEDALADHARTMREHPSMRHHDEPNAVTLGAGRTGSLVWRFDGPGTVAFACLEAGHYDAGMRGSIVVGHAAHHEAD